MGRRSDHTRIRHRVWKATCQRAIEIDDSDTQTPSALVAAEQASEGNAETHWLEEKRCTGCMCQGPPRSTIHALWASFDSYNRSFPPTPLRSPIQQPRYLFPTLTFSPLFIHSPLSRPLTTARVRSFVRSWTPYSSEAVTFCRALVFTALSLGDDGSRCRSCASGWLPRSVCR